MSISCCSTLDPSIYLLESTMNDKNGTLSFLHAFPQFACMHGGVNFVPLCSHQPHLLKINVISDRDVVG